MDEPWCYAIEWVERARPPAPAAGPAADPPARWLVLSDARGVGAALADTLARRGLACTQVTRGPRPDAADGDRAERGPLRTRLAALVDGAAAVNVVYLWTLDAACAEGDGAATLPEAHALAAGAIVDVLKVLAVDALVDQARLWIVTAGAQPAGGIAPDVGQAPAWGLAKSIAFEHPELGCRRIDLDPEEVRRAPAVAAGRLADELVADDGEDEVALRGASRLAPRLERIPAPAAAGAAGVPLRGDGTYLVTGGLGWIGRHVLEWLSANGARRIVVAARSGPSAAAEAAIETARRRGARVAVQRVDVAHAAEVARLAAAVHRPEAPLRGIVHLAGTFDGSDLLTLDEAVLSDVLAARAAGAWSLHLVTRDVPLDFFLLFSSTAAVLGSPGQGAFAASNAALDALAWRRRAQGLPATVVDWGPWGERDAPGADLVPLIPPALGCTLAGRLLAAPRAQVVVTGQDVGALLAFYPRAARARLFERVLPAGVRPEAERYERGELSTPLVAPRDRTERLIARIVARALGLDGVGVQDDFFELGGDSVVGAGILSRVNQLFDVEITFEDAIEAFTIERLAELVRARADAGAAPAGAAAVAGR